MEALPRVEAPVPRRLRRRTVIAVSSVAAGLLGTGLLMAPSANAEPVDHIRNGSFDAGAADWFTYGTTTSGVSDGRLCVDVPGGLVNPWDAGLGQNDIPLVEGVAYTLSFTASAQP